MEMLCKYPINHSSNVCVDTQLILEFNKKPVLNNKGFIKIYEYETDQLVDSIDFSIPAGPTQPRNNPLARYLSDPYSYESYNITNKNTIPGTPSADYEQDNDQYQLTIIGGFSDGFHFFPAMIKDNSVIIQLHHNMLEYNHRYYVLIDSNVINEFVGFGKKEDWVFTTKSEVKIKERKIVVSKGSTADFNTLQGAIDFIPNHLNEEDTFEIYVENGDYQELVYFRNKDHVTIIGESRDGVVIHYPNNEVFNPHPELVKTNERLGTFPSRRAAFAMDNCTHMVLRNLTIKNDAHGQAEGLLVNGKCNYLENVHIIGSGDALQTNGSAYYNNCVIDGEGDTILGRGPSYFYNTIINSYNVFMWIRNTKENHGNVFVKCTFNGKNDRSVILRLPNNHGMQYPNAECVLIDCELNNIPEIGYGPIDDDALSANIMEYNSHDKTGKLLDLSKRHKIVRVLDKNNDFKLIKKYSDYKYVLEEKFKM